ncbi:methionine synthase [Clostridium estertheticum]|uniref:vitamin B12 dependent-methionine synthase activation domain-containing protein n=1 Tax=Clostridium estertheticum TaxID=238834 RepID=UPI001CF37854|nr:vitamin B12 dependent-methionine synthase activation domain-containing protein [Clostridium estertheticum]MCB2305788.1 methionine synthase [Clostridium estertheticum]MCB2344243.1 methionine synthase [Clostridium estertheticum]MCB2348143.1 methionine synthase [Clostridium estertheticum]WAG45782.1 methionine synthase [Clostridium estertheticum]
MEIDKNEVLRYLGYKNQKIDKSMTNLIDECTREIIDISKASSVYEIFDIDKKNDLLFLLGSTLVLKDKDIKDLLINSEKCVVMAATLGMAVDSRLAYYSRFDITKGIIMDACASTAIEYVCDELQDEIMKNALKEDLYITTRYSPGYGDFAIDNGVEILNVLDAYKKIGLSITENSIMLPRKSVTALIGLSRTKNLKKRTGCANCKNVGCEFRKDGGCCE